MLDKRTKWSYCIGATGRDAAYTLVRNWADYGTAERDSMSILHDAHWDRTGYNAMFCPVYFYIYVPE